MQRKQHKSMASLSTVSDTNSLGFPDLEPDDFPAKVVMRKLKWSNDPRLRLNLQEMNQPSRPRPPTQAKDRLLDKRNIGSVAGVRPSRLSSLSTLQKKLMGQQVTRLPGAGLTRPALGATLTHMPKSLTPLKANTLLNATMQSFGRVPSRLRFKS